MLALGSKYRLNLVNFQFIASIRFPAFYSLIGVLRKRYDADLVKEVITLEKLDFKHKETNLDLDFLVSYRTNSVTKSFKEVMISPNCKMSHVTYVHVGNTFLVSSNKNISKAKETQDRNSCNFLLRDMGNNSDTCQDPDKVVFNFSSYNLGDH